MNNMNEYEKKTKRSQICKVLEQSKATVQSIGIFSSYVNMKVERGTRNMSDILGYNTLIWIRSSQIKLRPPLLKKQIMGPES